MDAEGKKSRSERTAEMRCRILDVSIELFVDQGYERTTTRQIALRAGILNGSLYNIFRNKEEIFSEAIVKVLWDAIRASEACLPDAMLLERLGFPLLLPVYVSSRSERLAGLLSLAGKNWASVERICDMMTSWLEENDGSRCFDTGDRSFRMKMHACLGAQSSILDMFVNDPEGIDPKEAMHTVARILLNIFDLPSDGIGESVDQIYDAIDTHDIIISGIRIRASPQGSTQTFSIR